MSHKQQYNRTSLRHLFPVQLEILSFFLGGNWKTSLVNIITSVKDILSFAYWLFNYHEISNCEQARDEAGLCSVWGLYQHTWTKMPANPPRAPVHPRAPLPGKQGVASGSLPTTARKKLAGQGLLCEVSTCQPMASNGHRAWCWTCPLSTVRNL